MLNPELERALRDRPEETLSKVFTQQRSALRQLVAARIGPSLRTRVDPSDVVQETLIDAFQRLNQYLDNPKVPFTRWLFTLAEQKAITAHRRHVKAGKRSVVRESKVGKTNSETAPIEELLRANMSDPLWTLQKVERLALLQEAISTLSLQSQAIVRMRFLEGRQLADIAEELGMTVDAVSKRAMRSLVKLCSVAKDLGISSCES